MELLVVLSMIALLLAILLPSMGQVLEIAYNTVCRNKLHEIGKAMHCGGVEAPLTVPAGSMWVAAAASYGSEELLECPKDDRGPQIPKDSLADYYILQAHSHHNNPKWYVSSVVAVLGTGEGVIQDKQIHYKDLPPAPTPHTGRHNCWCNIPVRKENQHLIAVQDEGMILITFEPLRIRIDSIIGCGVTHCGSDHWLMKGHCTDGSRSLEEDEVIMQLGGVDCRAVDKNSPYYIPAAPSASYGINSLVGRKRYGSQQVMVMDAYAPVVPVGDAGWADCLAPRHFGKVNYVTPCGSVQALTKTELYDEYLLYEQHGNESGSLWGTQASPRGDP